MDFSSEVLIDFGLNLAGYLIVAVMIYIILGRRGREQRRPASEKKPAAVAVKDQTVVTKPAPVAANIGQSEYISLSGLTARSPETPVARPTEMAGRMSSITPATRKENRRAIYQEARRLLASGKLRSDLVQQLPLTENELEMLTVTGKA